MILKIILSKEDNQTEVFQISNYYSEKDYLEADINEPGIDGRVIVLNEGLYYKEDDDWEEIEVLSDQGTQLIKFNKDYHKCKFI